MSKNTDPAKPQIERFRETARALGCDEDEAAFDEKLKVIARHKPKGNTVNPSAKPKAKQRTPIGALVAPRR